MGKCDLNGYIEFQFLGLSEVLCRLSEKIGDLESFDAFDGRMPFSDLAADISGVDYFDAARPSGVPIISRH